MQYLNILIIVIAIYMIAYSIYATMIVLVYHKMKREDCERIKNEYDSLRKHYENICEKAEREVMHNLSIRQMVDEIAEIKSFLYL